MENENTEEVLDAEVQDDDSEEEVEESTDQSELLRRIEELEERAEKNAQIAEDQRLRAEKAEKGSPKQKTTKQSAEPLHNINERLELMEQTNKLYRENYSLEEADEIISYAKSKNITIDEAKERPLIKAGIESLRRKKNTESKIPSSTNSSTVYNGKTYQEVVQSVKMTSTDKQRAFEAQRDKLLKRSGTNVE